MLVGNMRVSTDSDRQVLDLQRAWSLTVVSTSTPSARSREVKSIAINYRALSMPFTRP